MRNFLIAVFVIGLVFFKFYQSNRSHTALESMADAGPVSFDSDIMAASMERPVLVYFWAPWCGPCKQAAPAVRSLGESFAGKADIVKVNVDTPENQPIAQKLMITSIPAFALFRNGNVVDQSVGFDERHLRDVLKRHQ